MTNKYKLILTNDELYAVHDAILYVLNFLMKYDNPRDRFTAWRLMDVLQKIHNLKDVVKGDFNNNTETNKK